MTTSELSAALEVLPDKPIRFRLWMEKGYWTYFEFAKVDVENGEPFVELEEI